MTAWETSDAAVKHAKTCCTPEPYAIRVGERAHAEQCCIWHAAHLVSIEMYASGENPTAICEYCGGRADVRDGFHHLCAARAKRGRPVERLDVVDSLRCGCHDCRKVLGS